MASRRQRQYWMQMQRQSSDESCSSPNSSPKTHRRSSSFNGLPSPEFGSPVSNTSTMSSPTKTDSPLNVSWNSGTIASSRANPCTPDKMTRRKTLGSGEEDKSFRAYELIRQLSFSPPQKNMKRAKTADKEVGSSFDSDSSDKHPIGIGIGLDLDLDLDFDLQEAHLLRRSSSPLLGLKYLPDDEDMFM